MAAARETSASRFSEVSMRMVVPAGSGSFRIAAATSQPSISGMR